MDQAVTANYVAGKIYRYFVREELSAELQEQLGSVFRDAEYEIAPLLETIFLSRDFYSEPSVGTHIKSPVQLAVSTYRKLGLAKGARRSGFQRGHQCTGSAAISTPDGCRLGPG